MHVPEGFGKILVCANLISRFTCLQVLTFLTFIADISKSGTTQNLSEPTHAQCKCMILFAVSLLLPGWGWWAKPRAGLAQGLQILPYIYPRSCGMYDAAYPRCHVIAIVVKRTVPLGPTCSFRDVYCTFCYPRCAIIIVFACSNLLNN